MKVAIMLLNSGRGRGEVARQQARELVIRGWATAFVPIYRPALEPR